ncbi:MAG: molecular chaperone HtpG [Paludibacter sp.]|nr:MAG: molecular chaperone HtpG [Paludibacter sp.]
MAKGNIGVTSDNIFPVIKKFLYSDNEIFLREIVSNGVDATQKMKTLSSVGEYKGELGDLKVSVTIDKSKKTLTVSDNGIGMTADEIEKYINQIAFSGAEDFLDKYKNDAQAIIGHFGLGFYSAFMVSKKVEIFTLSHKEGAVAQHWSCKGDPQYTLEETIKSERGTDIVMHIDDDSSEFLEEGKVQELLNKYCRFLPIPVVFGKKKDWKEGKEVETDEDNVINDTFPAWVKKPSDLKEEDYDKFYQDLYPMNEKPLFHIHMNVDYPFNLTGILYFPKIKNNIDIQRNKIRLFSNQVYVTDHVENIVPEYLTLLHGVIDSPDIPLNVSRSYLQADHNVKKISNHITKKVADRLNEIFKNSREDFEKKWDDLKLFIQYGMLSDEKFYERAEKFTLLKNVDGKYFTFDEYKKLIEENQTDKDKNVVYLYTTNTDEQFTYIEAAKSKGYDVLLMDGQLDVHAIGQLEQKLGQVKFVRVDADVVDKLIEKEEKETLKLSKSQQDALINIFSSQLPKADKVNYIVTLEQLSADTNPVFITQNEFMRRMKEVSAMQGGGMMNFYGEMPDSFNIVVNTAHPLVEGILKDEEEKCSADVQPIEEEITTTKAKKETLKASQKDKKEDEIPQNEKDELAEMEKSLTELNNKKKAVYEKYGNENPKISKGEPLAKFVKRSVELL